MELNTAIHFKPNLFCSDLTQISTRAQVQLFIQDFLQNAAQSGICESMLTNLNHKGANGIEKSEIRIMVNSFEFSNNFVTTVRSTIIKQFMTVNK